MNTLLIRNARLVNEGRMFEGDLLVRHGRIDKIAPGIAASADEGIDATGRWLLPGMIDDQVHFTDHRLRSGDLSERADQTARPEPAPAIR